MRSAFIGTFGALLLLLAAQGAATAAENPNLRGLHDTQMSDHTRSVQLALLDAGHDPGPIDGIKGPKTIAALRRYAAAPAPTAPEPPRWFPQDGPRIAPDPVGVALAQPQSP